MSDMDATLSMESIKRAIQMLDDAPVPHYSQEPIMAFTQKHYIAIAEVLHQKRKEITAAPQSSFGEADAKAVKLEATNDVTLALCKLFKDDNPKFNISLRKR